MLTRFLTKSLVTLLLFFSVLFLAMPAMAAVLNVPSQYRSIQAAINAAQAGDTVLVAPGIYSESVVMKERINVIGSGKDVTVIKGKDGVNVPALTGASYSTLCGFLIARNGTSFWDANTVVLLNNVRHMVISNNEISGNIGTGLRMNSSNYNTIEYLTVRLIDFGANHPKNRVMLQAIDAYLSNYNHFLRNELTATASAMYFNQCRGNKLEHIFAVAKPTSWGACGTGGAITLWNSKNFDLVHNTGINLNTNVVPGAGLTARFCRNINVVNCIFYGFRHGLDVQRATSWPGNDPDLTINYSDIKGDVENTNLISNPIIVYGKGVLFLPPLVDLETGKLMPGSYCINAGDPEMPKDPDNTIADMGAYYL